MHHGRLRSFLQQERLNDNQAQSRSLISTMMATFTTTFYCDLFVALVCLTLLGLSLLLPLLSRKRAPFPPGPPPKSWIAGNVRDLPPERPWLQCTEWSKKYGSLVYFRMFNKHFLSVNSYEVAVDLLEKRSNIYSNRPTRKMIDLMGWKFMTAFKEYGDKWRAERRIFQQSFKPDAVLAYQQIQLQKIHDMLYGLLTTPEDFRSHNRTLSGAIIMSTVYGTDVAHKGDYYVDTAESSAQKLAQSLVPGKYAVNSLPFLHRLPGWFPGCGFQSFAREAREVNEELMTRPLKEIEAGRGRQCLASELLGNCSDEEQRQRVRHVCATSYAGGADTTVSSTGTFFYAMVNFYDIQIRAQEEIDNVIGNSRLPVYDDRTSLPYVEALYREVLRWQPVLPFGVAHSTSDEDLYNGYYIPKGTTVFPNVWAMSRDRAKYDNAEVFEPSRFIKEDGTLNDDDVHYVFGFGRRVCPGRHFASASLWMTIVSVLALFDIRKQKDAEGNEIPVDKGYSTGTLVHPLPFECSITPRSETSRRLITDARIETSREI
ncbi:cytochrome P450 [Crepidotus variabilis]|uniref:Cytochrome P450 n=1 Tax=Crepidotus variabilis TaxID=179855 RepID=A0A9P6ER87_9AGAR|nr:cytochrome P450 [Crepidotus variabilis]